MKSRLFALLALLVPLAASAEEELLPPEEAFRFELEAAGPETLRATWTIAEGYYLYRDLRRGWRITSPNLEQCGLLAIDYVSLAQFCADEPEWRTRPPCFNCTSR